jgi:hypothetical protein
MSSLQNFNDAVATEIDRKHQKKNYSFIRVGTYAMPSCRILITSLVLQYAKGIAENLERPMFKIHIYVCMSVSERFSTLSDA